MVSKMTSDKKWLFFYTKQHTKANDQSHPIKETINKSNVCFFPLWSFFEWNQNNKLCIECSLFRFALAKFFFSFLSLSLSLPLPPSLFLSFEHCAFSFLSSFSLLMYSRWHLSLMRQKRKQNCYIAPNQPKCFSYLFNSLSLFDIMLSTFYSSNWNVCAPQNPIHAVLIRVYTSVRWTFLYSLLF